MKPTLILGDEPRIVVNIARSLHRRGVPVDVATFSGDSPCLRSKAIRRRTALPDPRHEPTFGHAALLDCIEAGGYDLVIPASDTALAMVADHYGDLCVKLRVTCPPPEIVAGVLHKATTLKWAQECDVPIPKTITIESLRELEKCGPAVGFPVIAKPCGKGRRTTGTFKVRRFDTFDELKQMFTTDKAFGRHHLIQEYCPGEGVGVEVLMHGGQPVALFQHRRVQELPGTGGVSVVAVSEPLDPVLADHAVRLLRHMQWEGAAMVEFRVDRAGRRCALMEINGRYWGSLALSILAGVDFPWYEWQLAHGQHPETPAGYRTGVRMRWTAGAIQRWSEDKQSILRQSWPRSRTHFGLVKDCLPPARDALWSGHDPRPAVSELIGTLKAVVIRTLKSLLRRMAPDAWLAVLARSRTLNTRARRVYLGAAIGRGLKLRRDRLPDALRRARNILFVCHGNILRSPMAAALLRQALAERAPAIAVSSAGLHASLFREADSRGVQIAAEWGIDLSSHRAEPLSHEMIRLADVVIVMDLLNEAEVLARYPDARRKLFCLGICHPSPSACPTVEDPYRGDLDDVRRCYEIIRACIVQLAGQLADGTEERVHEKRATPQENVSRIARSVSWR